MSVKYNNIYGHVLLYHKTQRSRRFLLNFGGKIIWRTKSALEIFSSFNGLRNDVSFRYRHDEKFHSASFFSFEFFTKFIQTSCTSQEKVLKNHKNIFPKISKVSQFTHITQSHFLVDITKAKKFWEFPYEVIHQLLMKFHTQSIPNHSIVTLLQYFVSNKSPGIKSDGRNFCVCVYVSSPLLFTQIYDFLLCIIRYNAYGIIHGTMMIFLLFLPSFLIHSEWCMTVLN